MRIVPLLIIICILQCTGLRTTAQDIRFKMIERPKDLTWQLITAMAQDSTGFMWLATWNGIYRYDGSQYIGYNHSTLNPNSLAENRTECVFADNDLFVYVGTYGKGLDQLNPLTGIFKHFRYSKDDPNSLSNDTITVITKDRTGKLWVGTANGLNEFDPQTGRCKRYLHNEHDPSSISENHIRVVYLDHDGVIWIGTKGPFVENGKSQVGGLNRLDPKTGHFTRYLHDPGNPLSLIDNTVTAIFEDSRRNLMIGTAGDGLHIMNRQAGTFQRMPYDASHPENLSRPAVLKTNEASHVDNITFITEDKLGNIWIGTMENGINIYDPVKKITTHFGAQENNVNRLANSEFWRAFKSKEGVMWVTSWSASGEPLNLYQVNPYQRKSSRVDIGFFPICFLENKDESLWIGTDSCLVKKNVNGGLQYYPIKAGGKLTGSKNYVSSLVQDNKGNLWIAPQSGLYYFDTATKIFTGYFRQHDNPSGLGCDSVYILEKAGDGKLWVGTLNGLDRLDLSSGKFVHYLYNAKDATTLSSNVITGLLQQREGDLFIGHQDAIDRMDTSTGKCTRYNINGLVMSLAEDKDGTVWAGTNQGLYKFDDASHAFVEFSEYPRIINSGIVVNSVAMDKKNNLFLAVAAGLIRLNIASNEISLYGKDLSLVDNESILRTLLVKRNGSLLISDMSSYVEINPDYAIADLPKPIVLVSSFSLADKVIMPGAGSVLEKPVFETNEIQLRFNQNVFSFNYATIDYTEKNPNIPVLYMLENYDGKWRKANSEFNASYVNVPPGNYRFKVKATNATGVWVERTINIIINPPWWKTTGAYIFYGLVVILFSIIANRMIRRRILEKEKIKNREKELAHAKEIEKAYNELKLTQTQLIQSEKMASLGEMTAGIAHEIQNPLNFVNNFSDVNTELIAEMKQEIEKGNLDEVKAIAIDIEDNERKINHHGRRADSIVKGMLLHSRRSSGIIEPTDINALADEYLRLSYHGLRARDKFFNAAMQTEFDNSIGKVNIVPQDIGRVLLNLYNNAFYAVDEKMKMKTAQYEPRVIVSTKKQDTKVVVTVADNGNGIPEHIIAKIFQPFFTTKPTGQGTGLGLSLAYDIVKAHGGEITVHSKEGSGTKFILTLPG